MKKTHSYIPLNIVEWINSGEYKVAIDEMRTTIMRECKTSNSESSTASIFENELYFLIRSKTGIIIDYSKEKTVNNIRH